MILKFIVSPTLSTNPSQAAVLVVGSSSSNATTSSSRRHLNLPVPLLLPRSTAQIRPEPPPPYWAHYQHRPVGTARATPLASGDPRPIPVSGYTSSSSSSSSTDEGDASAGVNNAQQASPLSATAGAHNYRRNHPTEGNPRASARNHRYNIARQQQRQRIKEHLLSQDAFCPDLVRNCKISTDPQSERNSPEPEQVPSTSGYNRSTNDQEIYVEIEELNQSLTSAQITITNAANSSETACGSNTQNVQSGVPTGGTITTTVGDMGQNLSIRRPKISLTWVLREQAQQQQQNQQQPAGNLQQVISQQNGSHYNHHLTHSTQSRRPSPVKPIISNGTTALPSKTAISVNVPTRKKSRNSSKERLFSEKYVSDNNLTEYHNDKSKSNNIVHVLDGSSAPPSTEHHNSYNGIYRKSNRSYRKNSDRLKKKDRSSIYPNLVQSETVDNLLNNNNNSIIVNLNQEDKLLKEKSVLALKNTYSEPTLYTTVSEPSSSKKHRHRRRRERFRSQRFGYEIQNVDEFLSKCSLSSPGNIPVVLSSAATLYQTRPGSYQIEIPLPLGMVVNAVFKNQNWLYVQTPHAEEGYVAYETCLPLGILPPNQRSSSTSKPTPCWETNKDVFPRPSGNLTDSEKEIQQLRGGTRSEGRRTPRLKRSSTNSRSIASIACNSEKNLDSLYLRVANQPKSFDSQTQFAQLKLTTKVLNGNVNSGKVDKILNKDQSEKTATSGDFNHVPKQQQQQQLQQHQAHNPFYHHHHHKILLKSGNNGSGSASSVINAGHYHKTVNKISYSSNNNSINCNVKLVSSNSNNLRSATAVRQTLLAITDNYCSDSVSVQKGDVVTLLACKEYQEKGLKNYKQWFFVRTRDGHEGYIPAEAAGHGFL
ncbi:uncharacterized protein LOC129765157 isoform X2 [Toxorhynchites rutilus septentrionalis]|uniref:uncharacterized protein LOC129765157 isoform X2 n=1 Tax=Toxorhynchites rutilus septentrionalis TaxID=329112 RepID=UPI00247A4AFF|nr:uncharacterized protein LOC129765157 isoform X2 [Toxorhynchites rutilus septentrionalis]